MMRIFKAATLFFKFTLCILAKLLVKHTKRKVVLLLEIKKSREIGFSLDG